MDYNLAALKLLCKQLKDARESEGKAYSFGGILFQRAWLQGILVADEGAGELVLDDGTGLIHLHLAGDFLLRQWNVGMYVMVVGGYAARADGSAMIKVHKMVDLSECPHREAMWYLEVLQAYMLFYKPVIDEFS